MSTVAEQTATVEFDRTAWTTAVRRVSELAQARLPDALHGRIQRATGLVLSGGVFFEPDGHTCLVRSSDGHTWHSANGACPCEDHQRAPEHLCKHRISRMLYLRAGELLREGLPPVAADLTVSDNAAVPATSPVPPQYIVQIHGPAVCQFAGLLQLAHDHGFGRSPRRFQRDARTCRLRMRSRLCGWPTFDGGQRRPPANVAQRSAPHFRRWR